MQPGRIQKFSTGDPNKKKVAMPGHPHTVIRRPVSAKIRGGGKCLCLCKKKKGGEVPLSLQKKKRGEVPLSLQKKKGGKCLCLCKKKKGGSASVSAKKKRGKCLCLCKKKRGMCWGHPSKSAPLMHSGGTLHEQMCICIICEHGLYNLSTLIKYLREATNEPKVSIISVRNKAFFLCS